LPRSSVQERKSGVSSVERMQLAVGATRAVLGHPDGEWPHGIYDVESRLLVPVVIPHTRLDLRDGLVDNPYRIRPVATLVARG
jgi:hypothetical protein